MTGHGAKYDRLKEQAVAALLTHRTVEEAANSVGVEVKTLYRWMKIPEFDAEYREAKRAAFGQTIARLHQMSSAAATTLGKVMIDPSSTASVRIRAAESILNHTIRAIEIEDLEARIAQLEQVAKSAG